MPYKHGIYAEELPTSITPPVNIDGNSGLCVVFGTAPSHLASGAAKPNTPILCYYYSEAVKQLGYSDDFDKYTLMEAVNTQFVLYGVSPVVFINVLDPSKHFSEKTMTATGIKGTPANIGIDALIDTVAITSGEDIDPTKLVKDTDYTLAADEENTELKLTFTKVDKVVDGKVSLSFKLSTDTDTVITATSDVAENTVLTLSTDTILTSVEVESGGSEKVTLAVDVDYNIARNTDNEVVITLITDEKVVDDTISIKYREVDASKVTALDIIGGVDNETGEVEGLELIENIYPRLGVLPGIIIAPKFSTNTAVAAVMKAKARKINDVFRATAIVDIDTDEARSYTQAVNIKSNDNFVDTVLFAAYPKVALDGRQYHLSTHMAALMNQVDADNGGVPYVSPSNHNLQIDSTVRKDGSELFLGLPQANYLNGNGIVTAINFSGWKLWGNRTTAYPLNADVKDNFIPIRRMFNYIENSLILNFWSRIDNPMNRRLIESVINSANIWLDSLTSRGVLLGGRVEFTNVDNSATNLMDGILRFHNYITPPSPAREIDWLTEYDTNYLSTLFG